MKLIVLFQKILLFFGLIFTILILYHIKESFEIKVPFWMMLDFIKYQMILLMYLGYSIIAIFSIAISMYDTKTLPEEYFFVMYKAITAMRIVCGGLFLITISFSKLYKGLSFEVILSSLFFVFCFVMFSYLQESLIATYKAFNMMRLLRKENVIDTPW